MRSNRAPDPALDFASWILFEDPQILAVAKPAGVLSQGGEGGEGRNLVDLARAHLGVSAGIGVLHRLDRNVSGVVLLAKDPRAASKLTRAFANNEVERVYESVSLVRKRPAESSFIVDAWLRKDETRNQVEARDAAAIERLSPKIRGEFRESRTDVRVLEYRTPPLGTIVRCEVRPITGRSHQIRVHLAFVGLPIVGDPKYGVSTRSISRPLLHSTKLVFRHPRTSKTVEILCPLPWADSLLESLS